MALQFSVFSMYSSQSLSITATLDSISGKAWRSQPEPKRAADGMQQESFSFYLFKPPINHPSGHYGNWKGSGGRDRLGRHRLPQPATDRQPTPEIHKM